jgi:N-acetylglucosaminyldiphosphoundecaprenol N-acetyl-beta-D-mannosaminyltransferase
VTFRVTLAVALLGALAVALLGALAVTLLGPLVWTLVATLIWALLPRIPRAGSECSYPRKREREAPCRGKIANRGAHSAIVAMLKRVNILGYSVLEEPASEVAGAVCEDLNRETPRSFVFLNPHSIVLAQRDPLLRRAIVSSAGIFCDGVGLSLAGLVLNRRKPIRVYGYEFFRSLSAELSARGLGRVFFLGGTAASLTELVEKYRADFSGIPEVGSYAPPFREEFTAADIEEMTRRITDFRTDVLWVGLGSPKQEKVLHELMGRCQVGCGAAIGAVFDFYTGRIPHAPAWIRRMGMQWLHRLMLEPRRLWRRNLVSSPLFLWLVFRQLLSSPTGGR